MEVRAELVLGVGEGLELDGKFGVERELIGPGAVAMGVLVSTGLAGLFHVSVAAVEFDEERAEAEERVVVGAEYGVNLGGVGGLFAGLPAGFVLGDVGV